MKKIISLLISVMYILSLFTIKAHAAEVPINFQDPNLRDAFCKYLNIPAGSDVYKSQIQARLSNNNMLQFYSKNITSLEGMQDLRDLPIVTIEFDNNNISDISPLKDFVNVYTFTIPNNKLDNNAYDTIKTMRGLKRINLQSNNIDDLSGFSVPGNFPSLTELYITIKNKASDYSPLLNLGLQYLTINNVETDAQLNVIGQLSGLKSLQITNLETSSLNPICNLTNLTYLVIMYANNISDGSSLKSLFNLKTLRLGYSDISDVSFLTALTKLMDLALEKNKIADITPLMALKANNFYNLDLNDNYINVFSGAAKTVLDNIKCTILSTTPQNKIFLSDDSNNIDSSNSITIEEGQELPVKFIIGKTTDGTHFSTPKVYLSGETSGNVNFLVDEPSTATFTSGYFIEGFTGTVKGVNVGTTHLTASFNNLDNDYTKQVVTINVIPKPVVKGSITVKYQDENNNDIVVPDVLNDIDLGSYTENAKSFTGYVLNDRSSKTVTLTDSNANQTIIFNYTKIKGSITVKYQDDNGVDLEAPTVNSNLDLGSYTYLPKNFLGYTTMDTIKTVSLTDSNMNLTVVFNYSKVKGSITVKYQDENGIDLEAPTVNSNLGLGNYTYSPKSFPGYTTVDTIKTVSLTDSNLNLTVVFNYSKVKGSITVKYKDENGIDLEAPTVNSNLDLGSYTYLPKSFKGYTTVDTIRTVTLTDSNLNQTVVFTYSKIIVPPPVVKGSVKVKYVDQDNKLLEPITTENNLELKSYTYNAKSIQGYNLEGSSSLTVNLSLTNLSETIVFKYTKVIVGIVNEQQERLPQTGNAIDSKVLFLIGLLFMVLGSMIFSKKRHF